MAKTKVLLFLHTHWDREWYRSFEGYRYRLAQIVPQVLSYLSAHPEQVFLLDGQTVVLEDYFALYPDQQPVLANYIAAGRLHVGPWYVLPDEFLVSGEALIRNLQLGMRQAQAMGQQQFIGYLPDMFGHPGQLPQLFAQAGLEPALMWRGVNPATSYFDWQALDGTPLKTLHLTKGYYQDAFHGGNQPLEALPPFLEAVKAASPIVDPLMIPVGGDHLGLPTDFLSQVDAFNGGQSDYELIPSSLDTYIQALYRHAPDRPKVAGELRTPVGLAYVLPGVLSSRVYLKQRNDRLQNLLERQVEPILAWSWLHGMDYPAELLGQAWKYLLQNQPHDSICGCSIDEVHQDMLPRYRWSETMGRELLQTAWCYHWGHALTGSAGSHLNLINPGPSPFTGCVQAIIEFPADQEMRTFALSLPDGTPVAYEVLDIETTEKFIAEPDILPHWEDVKRFKCVLAVNLPAFSSTPVEIRAGVSPEPLSPMRPSPDPCAIDNGQVRVEIDPVSGLLRFYRKESHTWVRYLEGHVFVDDGDAGDSYNYSPPLDDSVLILPLQESQVEKKRLSQTLFLTYAGNLPQQLQADRQGRSKAHVRTTIQTAVRLFAGDPTIYFRTDLDNQAKDHRLRLLFRPVQQPFRCFGSTQWGVIERHYTPPGPVDMPKGQERPADTFPFEDWIQIAAAEDQCSVLTTRGLHEAALTQWDGRPHLAVTLLRAVGWLSRDDLRTRGGGAGPRMQTPEAQCLGPQTWYYGLTLSGNAREEVLPHIHRWRNHPLWVQGQPVAERLLEVSDGFTVTALKKADQADALVVRGVNLLDEAQTVTIKPGFACAQVYRIDPLERNLQSEALPLKDGVVTLHCRPQELVTLQLIPA
jgi:mannosylglycerate hydrolase